MGHINSTRTRCRSTLPDLHNSHPMGVNLFSLIQSVQSWESCSVYPSLSIFMNCVLGTLALMVDFVESGESGEIFFFFWMLIWKVLSSVWKWVEHWKRRRRRRISSLFFFCYYIVFLVALNNALLIKNKRETKYVLQFYFSMYQNFYFGTCSSNAT